MYIAVVLDLSKIIISTMSVKNISIYHLNVLKLVVRKVFGTLVISVENMAVDDVLKTVVRIGQLCAINNLSAVRTGASR
jgi:hypothetical protein